MDRPLLHAAESETAFTFGNLRLEPDGTLFRGGETIHLTPKELAALRVLLASPGHIVTPAQLKEALWPDVHVTADSVPRCISSLRSRLGSEAFIRTIYKRGYRLDSPVHRIDAAGAEGLPRLAIVPFAAGMYVPEYLGAAIAEDLGGHLLTLHASTFVLLPRNSVWTLAENGRNASEIGRTLGADLILTGTVQASTLFLRARAELLRGADGSQMWSEEVMSPRAQYPVLAQRLLDRVSYRLGASAVALMPASVSTERQEEGEDFACDALLRARHDCRSLDPVRMNNAVELLFKACLMQPPNRAARELIVKASLSQCLLGYMSPADATEQVRRAADAIPESDQASGATLPVLGWILFHVEHNLGFALRMIRDEEFAGPSTWPATLGAMLALSRHRFDEARDMLEEALHDDPWSPTLNVLLAWTHHLAGHAKESVDQAEQCLTMFPEDERSQLCPALILAFNNDPQRAVKLAHDAEQRQPRLDIAAAIKAYALARAGRRSEAIAVLERLQWVSRERYVTTSFTAAAYVALGDLDGAIAELRTAEEERCPWFFQILADPRLNPLHGNLEFERMRRLIGSMEATVTPESECVV